MRKNVPLNRNVVLWASLLGLSGVLAGTFGAHGLKGRLSDSMLESFEIGVRYQLIHAVALLALSAIAAHSVWLNRASTAFGVGVILFSGSLYTLAITEWRWLGWITPLGGIAFLVGWALVCVGAAASQRRVADEEVSP
jgi:uncharacterized membrane protein YgdD (TMEM256/DUF423 family)